MRSVSEIEKEILYRKDDIEQLRHMGGSISMALDDLEELYSELRIAKENNNNTSEKEMIEIDEYKKLYDENNILKNQVKDLKQEISNRETNFESYKKHNNKQLIDVIEYFKNRTFFQRVFNIHGF